VEFGELIDQLQMLPGILPSLDEVRAAAGRLAGIMEPTPCVRSAALSAVAGTDVLLKRELDNPTGSFKVRGAYNVLASMDAETRARGVVASSAGNHGLGVAYAANAFGSPAMLYVPSTAPIVKKEGIRALGANINDEEPDYDAAMDRAKRHAAEHHIPFINPCLGVDLLAGQGTVALEVLQQQPNVRTLVVCTGGGGLLGGMGVVMRSLAPTVRVVGAQSDQTAAMTLSMKAGHIVEIPSAPTLADGLAGQIDQDALKIGQYSADDMVLVSEEELADAIAWLHENEQMIVEGAGAVAVAALLHGKLQSLEGPVVAVVSGRNIDAAKHAAILAKHSH
jgi:threonine dehydratase